MYESAGSPQGLADPGADPELGRQMIRTIIGSSLDDQLFLVVLTVAKPSVLPPAFFQASMPPFSSVTRS